MKKALSLVLALALALTLAIGASAALDTKEAGDINEAIAILAEEVGVDNLKAAVAEFLEEMDIPADADAADLPANAGEVFALWLADKFGFADTDFADKLQGMMSNDFVSFLAGMYFEVPTAAPTTTEAPTVLLPPSGDSSVIAIAAFAALAVAGAAAFVIMKKKED